MARLTNTIELKTDLNFSLYITAHYYRLSKSSSDFIKLCLALIVLILISVAIRELWSVVSVLLYIVALLLITPPIAKYMLAKYKYRLDNMTYFFGLKKYGYMYPGAKVELSAADINNILVRERALIFKKHGGDFIVVASREDTKKLLARLAKMPVYSKFIK
ncbi:MAG: hypothetical protein AAF413_02680 [Patescibacteria group bacterium]